MNEGEDKGRKGRIPTGGSDKLEMRNRRELSLSEQVRDFNSGRDEDVCFQH